MALIEGVGDEVTVLFAVLACLLVLALAWVSTHTSESADPLPQPSGTPTPAQPSEAMVVTDTGRPQEPRPQPETQRSGCTSRAWHRAPSNDATARLPQEPLVLRLKFLNDSEQVARAWPHDTIGSLKRTQFPGREQQVRLIYQGQLLGDDTQTLGSLHLPPNCVLHCHVSTRVGPPHPPCPPGSEPGPSGLEIGSLLLPLLLLLLLLLWYCQIQYRPFFPLTATLGLAGFTLILSFLAFAMYRPVAGPSGPWSPPRRGSCCLPRPTSLACLFPLPWSPALRRRALQGQVEAPLCDLHGSEPPSGAAGSQPPLTVGSSGSASCCRCLGPGQSGATPLGPA
ncbi:LOW QUALITY PROTEIN: hypothetical protein QTO34_004847 [Cnephaeus nilssonii]|uniref:Transmembrane and ubiquitin-like domain-containing protein 1 n=1 Tax=Cnephaeus nilssonii TaxID=3371016 RepID=A0AA40LKT8_CNENI|nr:LOW QUALITY PROTEIN: hypothetical protein QTO34_004847 [Eptesicus nilssonii]